MLRSLRLVGVGQIFSAASSGRDGHVGATRLKSSIKSRVCDRCQQRKALDLFGRRTGRGDGRARVCKRCVTDRRNALNAIDRSAVAKKQREYRTSLTPEKREESRLRAMEWYEKNSGHAKERARLRRLSLRNEMLNAYGGRCSCCGESEEMFLTLDHVERDGADHRRHFGNTYATWKDLQRRGWPKKGYTLLCYNCNCGRERNGGVCPHRRPALRYVPTGAR